MSELMTLSVTGAQAKVDPFLGSLRALRFRTASGWLSPLHSAPWLDEPEIQSDTSIAPVERKLTGDFFCAPFGAAPDAPIHGWSANSAWIVAELVQSGRAAVARLVLARKVRGARIEKEMRLRHDAPLLYQSHIVTGGSGGLPVAHHPMVKGAERLCFSPKALAVTGPQPLEAGRNWLSYPAQHADIEMFPGRDGPVDLGLYPTKTGHEDFITLIEAPGNTLGWTAVIRARDIVFFLKDPAVLPVTMLWYSNGGRDYAPWNGRHLGVLGVEDGCAPGDGVGDVLADRGVPQYLSLAPGREHVVRHVMGAVPRPRGWNAVSDLRQEGAALVMTGDTGAPLRLPFDARFFSG